MDWTLPVNDMLHDEITKLNSSLIPPGFEGDVRTVRIMQESLGKLIDQLGQRSSEAQGLSSVITNTGKLRASPSYTLYLLKDANAKGGKGDVIGLLKVGPKHLYLSDGNQLREVEPLCVLDFYIVENLQRHGYGRKLFDYMLRDMDTSVHLLAIDGPSSKMERFLQKNYNTGPLIRQSNKFAVTSMFFQNSPNLISKAGCSTPATTPATGRYGAPKPQSNIASVIHGNSQNNETKSRESGEASPMAPEPDHAPEPQPEPEVAPEPELPPQPVEEPQPAPQRPSSLPVEAPSSPARPLAPSAPPSALSPAITASGRDPQLTDKGFFDVKFYHNKLW